MAYMPNVIPRFDEPQNFPFIGFEKRTRDRKLLEEAIEKIRDPRKNERVFPLWIGGHMYSASITAIKPCVVPHDFKRTLGHYCVADAKYVHDAIEAALNARKQWSQIPWFMRLNIFRKAAALLGQKYLYEATAAVMEDYSKNPYEAFIDVQELIDFWNFNAYYAAKLYAEQPQSASDFSMLDYRPLEGFVYTTSPNNFLAINGNLCTAPLMMGNVVVVKPSSDVVYSFHTVILKILHEAGLPKNVLSVIHGSGEEIGKIVLNHPMLAGVHFTGGMDTFKEIRWAVAQNEYKGLYGGLPRIVGETGGKDPIVVYDNHDPVQTAAAVAMGGFGNQGRKCSSTSRVYMTEAMWQKVREPLYCFMDTISIGDIADFGNYMGAIINEKEYNKISDYILQAQDDCRTGEVMEVTLGNRYHFDPENQTGWFLPPTVIVTANPRYRTMQEEIFGPVVTICVLPQEKFKKSVLRLCDTTSPYGLTGAIHTNDIYEYCEALEKLRYTAGNLYDFKTTGAIVNRQPFSGGRKSGTNSKVGWWTNLLHWVELGTVGQTFVKQNDFAPPYLEKEEADAVPNEISKGQFSQAVKNFLRASPKHKLVFARECRISPVTMHRWAMGLSAPHPLGRPPVIQFINEHMRSCVCND